jgi:hypothetical protein
MRRFTHVPWLVAALLALALTLAPAAGAHHNPAHSPSPYDVEFEGESMTMDPSFAGANTPDSAAYLGNAKHVFANGSAKKTVTTTRPSVHLFVRVKPSHCLGPPEITIKAGGKTWWSGPVNGEGFQSIGARISLPAGSHEVEVAFTNNHDQWAGPVKVCDRGVVVDHVAVVASPFSATGWRNTPLSDTAPLWTEKNDLFRNEWIDQIDDDLNSTRQYKSGVWVGTDSWSTPVYTVPFDQPRVKVQAPPGATPGLQEQWNEVPLPPDAQPAQPHNGGDKVLVVWQPSTNTLWEFFVLERVDDPTKAPWKAVYGGRMTNVSSNEGHFPHPEPGPGGFGASASSIALLAGMQRIEEVRRAIETPGVAPLDHALDFAVVSPRGRAGWCWPAQRTDDHLTSLAPEAIPHGTRFRLPASFDVDAYAAAHNMHPYAEMVAKTIKKYGMVARDSSSVAGWWAEDPTPTGTYPYAAFWNNKYPSALPGGLFENFPFDQLQVLAPAGTGCEDKSP